MLHRIRCLLGRLIRLGDLLIAIRIRSDLCSGCLCANISIHELRMVDSNSSPNPGCHPTLGGQPWIHNLPSISTTCGRSPSLYIWFICRLSSSRSIHFEKVNWSMSDISIIFRILFDTMTMINKLFTLFKLLGRSLYRVNFIQY